MSDYFQDLVHEEYCLYLENLDPHISPMSYEAFEWIKVREAKQETAEIYA